MQAATAISEALTKYLDLASDQMRLTAGNMANIDTPGYKTQGFDFNSAFAQALNADPADGLQASPLEANEVAGLTARPDGNNVSLDREAMQLAKSQLEFRTGVALLKSEYSRVMSAIHAEAK
jgi:flagellar basal-body rod protein FlgB